MTLSVPGKNDRYYQIPFGLHWAEVNAGCFMEVGWDGQVLAGEGEVEQSAYCIHAPIHRLVPEHACVLHTHMPYASALSRLEEQEILPIGQTEIGFLDKIAYDHTYTGPALDPAEGERLAGTLVGTRKCCSWPITVSAGVAAAVAEAYDLLYYPRTRRAGAALCDVDRPQAARGQAGGRRAHDRAVPARHGRPMATNRLTSTISTRSSECSIVGNPITRIDVAQARGLARPLVMPPYLAAFSLAGKIALVTGAGRGLGFEIAKALAGAGAQVVVNGRDRGRLDAAVAVIGEAGGSASAAAFDVADPEALRAALADIEGQHGKLEIVVGNVGQRDRRPLDECSDDDVRTLIEVDLVASLILAREAARLMAARDSGRLIFVTSIVSERSSGRDAAPALGGGARRDDPRPGD